MGDDPIDILTEREATLYRESSELLRKVERLEAENKELRAKLEGVREYRYLCHECCSKLMWEDDGVMVSCSNPECGVRFMGTR